MSEWREVELGSFIHVKHGFAFKGALFSGTGTDLVLTPGNFAIEGGLKVRPGKEKYYTGDFPSEFQLKAGDLLVVMTDLKQDAPILGSPAWVPEGGSYLHNQRLGLVTIIRPDALDRRFLYWLLAFDGTRRQLRATATGATVRHTAPERIYKARVNLPDLRTQRRVARILDSVSALLANNRERIALLEQVAQAIYFEWFVRFRYPGYENDGVVDSPIGSIPAGWAILPVSETIEVNPTVTASAGREVPFVAMADLAPGLMAVQPTARRKFGGGGSKFGMHDTLFARITPSVEHGKTGFVQFLNNGDVGMGSTEFLVFRGRRISPYSTYLLSRREDLRGHAILSMSGASGRQRVNSACFDTFQIAVPPEGLDQRFAETIAPVFTSVEVLSQINQRLANVRNLLLPKLVTGAIDVTKLDLDALLEESAG